MSQGRRHVVFRILTRMEGLFLFYSNVHKDCTDGKFSLAGVFLAFLGAKQF
jgi:hypothetical protein